MILGTRIVMVTTSATESGGCVVFSILFKMNQRPQKKKNPLKFRDGLTKLYECHQLCRMCFWRDIETPGYTMHGGGEKPQREPVWAVSDGAEL